MDLRQIILADGSTLLVGPDGVPIGVLFGAFVEWNRYLADHMPAAGVPTAKPLPAPPIPISPRPGPKKTVKPRDENSSKNGRPPIPVEDRETIAGLIADFPGESSRAIAARFHDVTGKPIHNNTILRYKSMLGDDPPSVPRSVPPAPPITREPSVIVRPKVDVPVPVLVPVIVPPTPPIVALPGPGPDDPTPEEIAREAARLREIHLEAMRNSDHGVKKSQSKYSFDPIKALVETNTP